MYGLLSFLFSTVVHIPAFGATLPAEVPIAANALICHSTGVADAGFNLRLSQNFRYADLSEVTFAGSRPVARLYCNRLGRGPSHPDMTWNFLYCRGYNPRYGNLVVRMYRGGIRGLDTASVRTVRYYGGRTLESELRFGRLECPLVR